LRTIESTSPVFQLFSLYEPVHIVPPLGVPKSLPFAST
jgi:hypothetical protein